MGEGGREQSPGEGYHLNSVVTVATSVLGAPTSVLGTISLEGRVWGVVRKERKQG